jgi:hypothetical protein
MTGYDYSPDKVVSCEKKESVIRSALNKSINVLEEQEDLISSLKIRLGTILEDTINKNTPDIEDDEVKESYQLIDCLARINDRMLNNNSKITEIMSKLQI